MAIGALLSTAAGAAGKMGGGGGGPSGPVSTDDRQSFQSGDFAIMDAPTFFGSPKAGGGWVVPAAVVGVGVLGFIAWKSRKG